MIEIKDLSYKYPGQKERVFSGFNLTLEENRIYGLLGKNGTGKTTLLYHLCGLLIPDEGSVRIDGHEARLREAEMLREIFLVPDEFELQNIPLRDYVRLHRPFYPRFSDEVLRRCLNDFELDEETRMNSLSLGQRKKLFMSFALATQTKYLFMDEPTNGLDIPSKSQFRRVIAQCMADDRIIIISTHQVHDVEQLLDHILILDQRDILLNASIDEIGRRYTFEYRTEVDMADDILYAEPSLQGNAVIVRHREGTAESQVSLELLFNAVIQGKI